jgi:hypothetical protein
MKVENGAARHMVIGLPKVHGREVEGSIQEAVHSM